MVRGLVRIIRLASSVHGWPKVRRVAVSDRKTAAQGRIGEKDPGRQAPARSDEECWWDAMLSDPRAARPRRPHPDRALGEVRADVLRVECRRCMRTVEIKRSDAIALFGAGSEWRHVGQHLLDDGCTQRTGRHEEDGCWPDFR
jgi:hypothetical protein